MAGGREHEIALEEASKIRDFLIVLEARWPSLERYRGRYRLALNQEFVDEDALLRPGDELALLPPVSGGEELALIVDEPIEVEPYLARVRRADCGAVCMFLGTVRDCNAGLPVETLEYTTYRELAATEMARLIAEARQKFSLGAAVGVHRVGLLRPEDIAVLVAVSSAHRKEAFEGSRWLIDTIKGSVPLWKKEAGPEGAVWIEGDARVESQGA